MTNYHHHWFASGLPHWNGCTDSIGNQKKHDHNYNLLNHPVDNQQNSLSTHQQTTPCCRCSYISNWFDPDASPQTIDIHQPLLMSDSRIDTSDLQQKYSEFLQKWYQNPSS